MVEREQQEVAARPPGPALGDQRERDGVAAARDGDREGPATALQEMAVEERFGPVGQAAHFAWVRVAAARLVMFAGALG